MAAPKHTAAERDEFRGEVARLHARGYRPARMAAELGISRELVNYYLGTVRKLWKGQAARDFELDVACQIEELNEIRREAWAAWMRSLEPKVTETTESEAPVDEAAASDEDEREFAAAARSAGYVFRASGKTPSPKRKTSEKIEYQTGNPAYLQVILRCNEREAALLGLDAPKKIDIEHDIRDWARQEGLDEDAAVQEARRQIRLVS